MLKCVAHLKSATKVRVSSQDSEHDITRKGEIFGREIASIHCPVTLRLCTSLEGYWQLASAPAEVAMIEHFPHLV